MDLRGKVRKRVWEMPVFGLKWGEDSENLVSHPPWGGEGVERSDERKYFCVLSLE